MGRQLGDNQSVAEIEPGSFGNGGGRGKGGQHRGGGAGRKARQKIAPVDLHAPAPSCPASAGQRITSADSCQGACVSPVGACAAAADASDAARGVLTCL